MNGGDKLVKGVNVTIDNEATVESTVNILVSDVVVTEGGSCVVVTAVGVISDSKLFSVIRFTTLAERLVIDTTSDDVIKDRVLDGVSVNAIDVSKTKPVDIAGEATGKLLITLGILVDVTSTLLVPSTVGFTDTNNVSVVSKLFCILLDIISVDCIIVGTITLVILMTTGSDVVVTIVDKLPTVTSVDSVNSTVGDVIG